MTMLPDNRRQNWVALLLIMLLAAAAVFIIAQQVIAYQDYPFDSDEANHANRGLALYLELRAGDFSGFAREFYGQDFYPPGASGILALFFSLFGTTAVVARLFSAIALFLAMPVMLALSIEMDEKVGWLGGVIAVVLTLTAQPILINSALAMLEAPGLLISLLLLWAYVRAIKNPSRQRLLLTSALLAATFLTKYTFGVITMAALILLELSLLLPALFKDQQNNRLVWLKQQLQQRWIWLFGPFALVMLLWLGSPTKLAGFFGFTRPLSDSEPWLTTANLLFYPRSFALHYSPSPLFALVTAVSLIWAVFNWRDTGVRLLLIYFVSGMTIIMLVNHPQNPRFIATVAPAAHILTGVMAARAVGRWRTKQKPRATAVALVLAGAAFLVISILSVPTVWERLRTYPSVMGVAYETSPTTNDLAAWIAEHIPYEERFFVVNYWDRFSPQTLAWYLGANSSSANAYSDLLMPATVLEAASPKNLADFEEEIKASQVNYIVLLSGGPWGAPAWPDYTSALANSFAPIATNSFTIEQFGGSNWLKNSLLTQDEWEKVKADSKYLLDIEATIYRTRNE